MLYVRRAASYLLSFSAATIFIPEYLGLGPPEQNSSGLPVELIDRI